MSRWVSALAVATVLALACAAPADEPDALKAKLEKLRSAYETELAAAEKGVSEALDRAEAAARQRGDKAALNKVKAERETFELTGTVPKSVTATTAHKVAAARKTLDAALSTAVKEYIKANNDAEAEAAERERAALKDAPALRPRYFLVVNKNSELVLAAAKDKGEPGTSLLQAKTTGADNQLWSLVPAGSAGVYLLRNKAGGGFAGVGTARNAGHTLTLGKETGDGYRWVLERDGFHFLFQNVHSKLYISVDNASKEAGSRILQWPVREQGEEFRWDLVAAKPK